MWFVGKIFDCHVGHVGLLKCSYVQWCHKWIYVVYQTHEFLPSEMGKGLDPTFLRVMDHVARLSLLAADKSIAIAQKKDVSRNIA